MLIRDARRVLEEIRAEASELEVARATAESDLAHLAQTCVDAVQVSLDDVLADVEQMERPGRDDAGRRRHHRRRAGSRAEEAMQHRADADGRGRRRPRAERAPARR